MTDFVWPAALPPQTMAWMIQKAGVQFRSPYAGSVEAVTFPGWFWKISVTLKPRRSKDDTAGLAEAFFEGLAGGEDAVLVFHWLRPVPRGTLRGLPIVANAAARGARSVDIATGGTLVAGDLFKIGSTVLKAYANCAPVGGVLTVPLVGRLRAAVAPGDAVTWDHPTVRCLMPAMGNASAYAPGVMSSTAIDLEEAP